VQRDDVDEAVAASGAGPFQVGGDVRGAADVPVVARDAFSDAHAPVLGAGDDDNLVGFGAGSVERLPFAVFTFR